MSAFGGLIFTNRGRNLQAKAQAGAVLNFTRIAVGDGTLGGSSIADLNVLKNEVKSLGISRLKTLSSGKAVVGTILSNQSLVTGFYFREIGVFAQDPDLGEILYCYGNAGANAEYIPAGGGPDVIEKNVDVITIVGNASNITATIDQSLLFATTAELNAVIADITAIQTDLTALEGNLNNLAGAGRTTETVKGNADALTAHLAEYAQEIENTLPRQSITLSHGLNAVNAPRASLLKPKFTGRTLVNLLGKDGNCEDVGKWLNVDGSSFALDPAIKMFGTNSIKVSSTVTGVFAVKTVSKYNVAAGKYYLLGGWAKNIDCAGANGVKLIAVKGSDGITGIKSGPSVSIGTSFVFTYAKLSPADIGSETTIHAYLQGHSTVMGQNFNFDGLCLYEITQAEYDALATMTDAQIAAKYPYVDSVQVVQNPAAKASSSYLYLQTPLYEGETLEEIDGQWVRTKKWEKKVLDGSLDWQFYLDFEGYKSVSFAKNDFVNRTGYCVKYDGKILKLILGMEHGFDGFTPVRESLGAVFISIPDTDSGWGDSYTPTVDEIKAYFYGWKMYISGSSIENPYNGTGTKAWVKILFKDSGFAVDADKSITCPATEAGTDSLGRVYTPYQLHYQLATPTTEIVPHEGELALHEGLNQVEVFEGVVVRELANPYYATAVYRINNTPVGDDKSALKYKLAKFINIYKNNLIDTSWTTISGDGGGYGNYRATLPVSRFDPTAQYSVTYIALPEEFTAPCPDVQAELTVNMKTTVDSLVDELAKVAADVGALSSFVTPFAQYAKASAFTGGNQSIAALTKTKILLTSGTTGYAEISSDQSCVRAKKSGQYLLIFKVLGYQITAGKGVSVNGLHNGNIFSFPTTAISIGETYTANIFTAPLYLHEGDVLAFEGYHNDTGSKTFTGAGLSLLFMRDKL